MSILNEGMREGDLEDLVLPMVTIDEYESKLDDNAIVMGFYVNDKDAADDLNRFLQKSAVEMLDTEVSPAPDQHGYYNVFIELVNDQRIVENMMAIVEEVSPLVGITAWQMRLRGLKGVKNIDAKLLTQRMASLRSQSNDKLAQAKDGVMEFLRPSDLSGAILEEGYLTLSGRGGTIHAELLAHGEMNSIVEAHNLSECAVDLGFGNVSKMVKITSILGEHWNATQLGDITLLQRVESDEALLLKGARLI